MNHLLPHRFKLLAPLCLILMLTACKPPSPGIWKDGKISSWNRSKFHDMNKEALGDLKANNLKSIKLMLSKDLIDETNTERQVEMISNRLTDDEYVPLAEYYVVNRYKDADTVPATGENVNRYGLQYPETATEMYFAFFVPRKSDNKYLVSLIYAKLDYGWRITEMDVSPYTINGRTGPELYELGKSQYAKKHLTAALNTLALAVTCIKPSDVWQYPDADSLHSLYAKVVDEANEKYKFPLVLHDVSTGPMIVRVYNLRNAEGTFPEVYYMTHININDTIAVKKENLLIQKSLSKLTPGIDENVRYILYSAYNKRPSG